ncbi:MAG TPA: VOC family protein, partial [Terriglobales bacterium]
LGLAVDQSRPNVYHVGVQSVELEPLPANHGHDLISHVAFATPDAEGVRKYLASHGVTVPEHVSTGGGTMWFAMKDPEGNPIEFVQSRPELTGRSPEVPVSKVMIHAGFVVHDRAAEDKFYKDLLGFHLYWQGGMKDDETDWVDMQVPDGTQWLEYMLVRGTEHPSPKTLGVLNHIALGVPDMSDAAQLLKMRGWKPTDDEKQQIGKDGKWQLNLYDPDGTRVELMEFTPVQTPCCAPYTGQHPH